MNPKQLRHYAEESEAQYVEVTCNIALRSEIARIEAENDMLKKAAESLVQDSANFSGLSEHSHCHRL